MVNVGSAVPESVITSRLTEIERLIAELSAERNVLQSLRKKAIPMISGASDLGGSEGSGERPAPKEAIIAYVTTHPGHTPTEIADALIGKVSTTSKDVRNVLRTTVAKMAGSGQFRKEEGNRIFPKPNGDHA